MAERIPVLFLLLILLGPAYEAAQQKQLDVPYESTPYPVVDEMLRIAKINGRTLSMILAAGMGASS
jgi:hypothetical protein